MKSFMFMTAILMSTSMAWAGSVSISCKTERSEFRIEMTEGTPTKLFYKGQASFGYLYQLEEVEVDANLNCSLKNTSPLILNCESRNDYLVRGRETGPEGVHRNMKATLRAVSRTVTDETAEGKTTKVSNILSYRVIVGLGEQVTPLKVKGNNLQKGDREPMTFELDLGQGLQDTVECVQK
jgi:hypothetical protein